MAASRKKNGNASQFPNSQFSVGIKPPTTITPKPNPDRPGEYYTHFSFTAPDGKRVRPRPVVKARSEDEARRLLMQEWYKLAASWTAMMQVATPPPVPQVQTALNGTRPEMLFRDFVAEFLNEGSIKSKFSQSSMSGVGSTIDRYILSYFGDYQIGAITPRMVENFIAKLDNTKKAHGKDGEVLSSKTVYNIYTMLASIMTTACTWEYIDRSPCSKKVKPAFACQEKFAYTEEQAKELVRVLLTLGDTDSCYVALFILMLMTGIRRSEALGLRWSDIKVDGDKVAIYINKAWTRCETGADLKMGLKKNEKPRYIGIPKIAVEALKRYKKFQDAAKRKHGAHHWGEDSFIFTCNRGGETLGQPIHPDTASQKFKRVIKAFKLPPISLHGLRHTFASIFYAHNRNILKLSRTLGHCDVGFTMKQYVHLFDGEYGGVTEMTQVFGA